MSTTVPESRLRAQPLFHLALLHLDRLPDLVNHGTPFWFVLVLVRWLGGRSASDELVECDPEGVGQVHEAGELGVAVTGLVAADLALAYGRVEIRRTASRYTVVITGWPNG